MEFILFVMAFLIVYVFYKVLIIKQAKRRNSKKRPAEINYLIYAYKIDIKKLNYQNLLNTISIVSAFDISLIVSIISLVGNMFLLQLVVAVIIVIPIFLISYHFVGIYYRKKGCIKDV